MLTRLEWTELTFESDQMTSVDYLRRKAKQSDISQHLGNNILEKLQRTDQKNVKKKMYTHAN